jgi:hypothetical protein
MILVAWRRLRSADSLLQPYSKSKTRWRYAVLHITKLSFLPQWTHRVFITRIKRHVLSAETADVYCDNQHTRDTPCSFVKCQSGGTCSRCTVPPQHANSGFMSTWISVVWQVSKHALTCCGQSTQTVTSLRTLACVATVRCSYDGKGTLERLRCKLAANHQYDA